MKNPNAIEYVSLYHHNLCPYCAKVKGAMKFMELQELTPELRNIRKKEQFRRELVKGGGKQQVPALKVEFASGDSHWLYESDMIIDFLSRLNSQKKSA